MMSPYLKSALAAAHAAADEIMRYYRGDFEVELKADQTPVTVADRRAEEIIREILLGDFPDHGFFGEEGGKEQENAEFLWLVDPIDGTKSFVGGYGMFSTQMTGLCFNRQPAIDGRFTSMGPAGTNPGAG
jgi:histidinol-phosphatase